MMKKISNYSVILLCLTAIISCNTPSGIFFYCDDIVKNTYYKDNVAFFFNPVDNKLTGVYVYNNTDKILFVDRGTSFLKINKRVETIYKATTKLQGKIDYHDNMSGYISPFGVIDVDKSGFGILNGDMLSEKRIIPIAPHATQCITIFSFSDFFVNTGLFVKTSSGGPYKIKKGEKRKRLTHGNGFTYNADNSILKFSASLRYSFSEDMTNCVDVHVGNYLKAWIVDNYQGLYNYENANLPYAGQFRKDSLNYSLFSLMSTY